MVFRRAFAAFLVLIFVFVSVAAFVVFAVSNTFFRPAFFEEDIQQPAYDFLVNFTVTGLRDSDPFIESRFTETDLRREITAVFPQELFQKLTRQISTEMQTWKEDPNKPLTLSLSIFRESLLTLAHNLSFQLFESLPECGDAQIPVEDQEGLPTCVPPGAEYNVVAAPFSDQFEKAIYAAVPEQIQIDLNSSLGQDGLLMSQWFALIDTIKLAFYGLLLVLTMLIALLIYKPFTAILVYEGIGFFVSGVLGVAIGLALNATPLMLTNSMGSPQLEEDLRHFTGTVVNLFTAEIQKAALVFLALGASMILVRVYLKYRS